MTDPRCPFCNTAGVKNITARPIKSAVIIYCAQCGAIFGVVPKQSQVHPTEAPQADPLPHTPDDTPRPPDTGITPEQAVAHYNARHYGGSTNYIKFPPIVDD